MNKYIKFFIILLFLGSFVSVNEVYSQPNTTQTTIDPGGDVSGIGQQFNTAGFRPPLTKKEERMRRKARRLSLSRKQLNIYNRKQRNKELTFFEKVRYPFIKRKKDKLDDLQKKADAMVYEPTQAGGGAQPGYMQTPKKYELNIKEKDIISKYDQDSSSLDKKEMKLYKKAIKKQKKADKYLTKYQKTSLSNNDSLLIHMYKNHPDSLSRAEKKDAKRAIKVRNKNKKVDDRIINYQVDSTLANGGWVPVSQRKFSLKRFFGRFSPKLRPSSYVKKQRRINRRWGLTDRQKDAVQNSGRNTRWIDKHRANRAVTKKYVHKKKSQKLAKKEYLKSLPRKNRRIARKNMRNSNNAYVQRGRQTRTQRFFNLFKKRQ